MYIVFGILITVLLLTVIVMLMLRGRGDSTSLKFELDRLEEKIRNEFTSNRKEMSEAAAATRMELTASVHALGSGQQQQLKNFSERLDSLQNILTQSAQGQREELTRSQQAFTEILTTLVGRLGEAQDKQLAGFAAKLAEMTKMIDDNSKSLRKEQGDSLKSFNDANVTAVNTMTVQQKELLETLRNTIEQKFESIRLAVSEQLDKVRQENSLKLEEMRKTVDEKLHDTLEKRLGESFKQVSDRLEQVHKGLGEMQQLAAGVGDLKKVLTNVKVRGTWGEVQLGSLLEQILTQEQYVTNYCPKTKSQERVEFAIRLPGEGDEPVYLPIDAKFPREDYERLIEASEKGDVAGVETATKQLEARISQEARDIRDKYISPPNTTDFAILYLPTEGLYAEALRRPGLSERLQRDCRVVIAGPTTLTALLNSLQMGFRTLAIQKRSSEVWKILAAVKKKFASFGEVFDKVQKKIQEADKVLEDARSKTKTIDKALNTVETMSDDDANRVLAIPVIPELALNNEEDQEQQA